MVVNIINDQHVYSGIFTHTVKIYENLRRHGIESKFFNFLLYDVPLKSLPSDTIVKKGLLFGLSHSHKTLYNLKLATNFLSGTNWRVFNEISEGPSILSSPSLLPLSTNLKNSIAIAHDLFFIRDEVNIFLKTYMKKMYKLYNEQELILANSNYTKDEFVKKLRIDEEKIVTIYPSFDLSKFSPGVSTIRDSFKLKNSDKVLLSVGGDNPNKNVETVLRVLKDLPDNYKLIRVGPNFNTVNLIKKLGISNRVLNINNIGLDTLIDIYRASDYLVFPSLLEGFGSPVIEAMACGTPVITSNRMALPEIAGKAGVIMDPMDVNGIQESIMELERDENARRTLIKKGLERSKCFGLERQFHTLLKVLNSFTS